MIAYVLTVVLAALIYLAFQSRRRKSSLLPPGPPSIPILGNLLQIGTNPTQKFGEWAKRYGKVCTVYFGSKTVIVLNDLQMIKEVYSDVNMISHPEIESIQTFSDGPYGILGTNGHEWKEQRRWSLRKLRDLGFGKHSMEQPIMVEVNDLLKTIQETGERPIQLNYVLDVAVLNSLWAIINGQRSTPGDPVMRNLIDSYGTAVDKIQNYGLVIFPWFKYVFPGAWRTVQECGNNILSFVRKSVASHWDSWSEGDSRDFIDEYIGEIKKTTNPDSTFYGNVGRKHLEGVVSDFLLGGSETTGYSIAWAIGYISQYPEIQQKLQSELDQVVGRDRTVTLLDRDNLPYLEAVILETLRFSSLLTLGFQRVAGVDKKVGEWVIPKGAWLYANFYYVHHDPSHWDKPDEFLPERFLSEDGSKIIANEALVAFSTGRRNCIGETVSKYTLLLFLGNLFQKYSVSRVEPDWPLQCGVDGLMRLPKNYNYIFKERR